MNDIINFYSYSNNLLAGGQPSEQQIGALKNNGVEVVVNISPTSTKNFVHEETELVEKLGMDYVHFPIDCSNLQSFHYPMFRDILKNFNDKKVFVHCGGNIKTSNLIHMYNVLELGKEKDESLAELQSIQIPEEKWYRYFEKFNI